MISLGRSASDNAPQRTATTWTDFVSWLYQHPRSQSALTAEEYAHLKGFPSKSEEGQRLHAFKNGPYVVMADHGGGLRHLSTLLGSYAVPLDFDSGHVTAEVIRTTLTGYAWVAHTTFAHADGSERWRVFVPVSAPMDAATHRATWQQLSNAFVGGADPAAKDASRLSYLPGPCLHPTAARIIHADGAFFTPAQPLPDESPVLQVSGDGPVAGWSGPLDDETLIAIASSHRMRPDERFGQPVHFAMLWTANEQWLAQRYPPSANENGQPYSRTQADMALAGELSYWTGSDRERMCRLMLASALKRDDADWQERKMLRAVDRAIENAKQWHFMSKPDAPPTDGPVTEMAVTIDGAAPPPPPAQQNEVATAIEAALANAPPPGVMPGLNDYWSYHRTGEFIHRPTGDLHPATVLDNVIGKDARMALYSSRPVHRLTWAPGHGERFQQHQIDASCDPAETIWLYNTYKAPRPHVTVGDVTPWVDLLRKLYPNDADHFIKFAADAVQAPQHKCNHAMVLGSGTHGIGKDTLLAPLKHAVGLRNFRVISPSALASDFNPWVASRVLQISESSDRGEGQHGLSRYDMYERCKDLCAAPPTTIEMNDKHAKAQPVLNVVRAILTTNHMVDGLYIPPEDRRHYCAWSEAERMTEEESVAIWKWYNAGGLDFVANWLTTFDLDALGWNRAAPPPRTAWWHQLVEGGKSTEDDRFKDAVDKLGKPEWLTPAMLAQAGGLELAGWMAAPGNKRKVEREMDRIAYRRFPNPHEPDRGRWHVGGARVVVYRRADVAEKGLLAKFGAI